VRIAIEVAGFDFRSSHYRRTTLGKLFTHTCLCYHIAVQVWCGSASGVTLAMRHTGSSHWKESKSTLL